MPAKPPSRSPDYSAMPVDASVACTNCGSKNVQIESLFGGHASEMLMRCSDCRTFFSWFKWRGIPPSAPE